MPVQARRALKTYAVPATLFAVVWVWLLAADSGVGTASIFPVLDQFGLLGLIALGVGINMLAGELDLSCVSVAAAAGVIAIKLEPLGLFGAIVAATVLAGCFGALQGYLIARLAINSIVFTIGTLILVRGAAYTFGNDPQTLANIALGDPLLLRWGVFSITILVALGVYVLAWAFLTYVRHGREIYAVGGDREEARAAGVRVRRTTVITFTISAACAGPAGSMASYQGGSAGPTAFDELLLLAISAALIGGISLKGGRGSVVHIALGVATLAAIGAGLAQRGQGEFAVQLVTGVLLIAVIAAEYVSGRIKERSAIRLQRSARPGIA